LACLVLAVFAAGFVQILVGFGFALLSVPMMALAIPTQEAVVVSTVLGLLSSGIQTAKGVREADWLLVRRVTAAALAGIPVGFVLYETLSADTLRLLLGIGVLIAVYLLARGVDFVDKGAIVEWSAGFVSGALASSLSTNGPPLVFALQGRRLPIAVFRSTINAIFVISGATTALVFAIAGDFDRRIGLAIAAALPALLLGVVSGFRVRPHVDEERARHLVLGFLALAGISSLIGAFA
jgi:uncharacterized membrane protein YfcA